MLSSQSSVEILVYLVWSWDHRNVVIHVMYHQSLSSMDGTRNRDAAIHVMYRQSQCAAHSVKGCV